MARESPPARQTDGRELAASRAHCREVTRRHARSFYFASHALPPARRTAAYALYAFCRLVDDLLDEGGWTGDGGRAGAEAELNGLLDRLYAGEAGPLPLAAAFHAAVRDYGIPPLPFRELLHGVCLDREPQRLETWDELRHYAYHVASVVGLIMCPVLGLRDPAARERAVELGIAMQLTNILRDVKEDLARGRRYLPAEEMRRFGVTDADLAMGRVTDGFRALMQFQIARARAFYRSSEAGIGALAPDGSQLTVWLMRWVYAGILGEIERQGFDVFRRRAAVSGPRKLALAVRAWRASRRRAGAG
ncbi:MAG: phytoene/squalene synthase family protein [Verrucomicrobiota bacterium]